MNSATEDRPSDDNPTLPPRKFKRTLTPPFLFRMGRWLADHKIRGGFRLIEFCRRLGQLDVEVVYELGGSRTLIVPLYRDANSWSKADVLDYDNPMIESFCDLARECRAPVTLVDCGADIGINCVKFLAAWPETSEVIAVEPNSTAFTYLKENLSQFDQPVRCIIAAVSDFAGKAELVYPEYDPTDHGAFINPKSDGPIDVVTIDSLGIQPHQALFMKIDVEGEELKVLKGARQTLAAADRFVVAIEAHREVARRVGQDPIECVNFLNALRPCDIFTSPPRNLDYSRALVDQFEDRKIDIICASRI